jgi:two-component system phosphate regulon sensor histidine kinase PhoR
MIISGIIIAVVIGVLISFLVLNLLRIRKLENIRKDFVSSVSHELKTPITSIRGFVETLLDESLTNPVQTRRYLEVIAKNAQRLDAIIDDLLTLSRLEEKNSAKEIVFKTVYVKSLLAAAVELSNIKAQQKNISIVLDCDDKLKINANTLLLEQAVFNLIDNAIKFSAPDGVIKVFANESDREILISVQDSGSGIEPKHLPRIFERFYVVDKSRSRKLGGTGLGLAIVKHIVQLHNGHVSLESIPEKGTKFTIHLPTI